MYDLKDILQGALGAFSSVLFFFVIRANEPLIISATWGFYIGIVWLVLLYNPFRKRTRAQKYEHMTHFIGTLLLTVVITAVLSVVFKIAVPSQLFNFGYFGTGAWVGVWIGLPMAMLFDMRNLDWVVDKYYTNIPRGRRRKR